MRILVVTHYYSTHAGGIEIVAGALASRLAASHDVTWAASDCDPLPDTAGRVRLVPMRALNVVERVTGLPFPLWGPRSLLRLWRETASADVIHLHDAAYVGNWAAFVFGRWRRKPVIITQHAGVIRYRSWILRAALRALHTTVVRALLSRATRVVFISPVVRAYFAQFVTFRVEPEIIWNGVDTDIFRATDAAAHTQARVHFGLPVSDPIVLFVGRFVEAKGLPLVEQLARRLPDVTWVLAGWGPIDPRAWNVPNVRVFDSLRGRTLAPLYQAADILVLPSLGEGLPLVVQEALACGLPALVDTETAKAVGAPATAVFACDATGPDAVDAWASAIRKLLDDGVREARRSEIARFARDRWSWRTSIARYSDLLKALTGRLGAPSQGT
jgi:glycosyltransferase involved in cell wall biosynthesis